MVSKDDSEMGTAVQRAPWSTPRVIVSDLGDARAQTIIPGGDGSISSYAYGS